MPAHRYLSMFSPLPSARAPSASPPPAAAPIRLFLHGFTGAPASWDAVSAELDATHVHVYMRLLGHHPDVAPLAIVDDSHAADAFDRTVATMCAAVAELCECISGGSDKNAAVPTVHLIGYSLGARLALGMLVRAPHLFARATLFGGHPGLQNASARAARAEVDAGWERLLREQGGAAFMRAWLAQPLFARLARLPHDVLAADLATRTQHDATALADAFAATSLARMPSHWHALADVRAPVTFAAGSDDEKFVALLQGAHAVTPGSILQTIPGAGHNVLLEAPKSVARLIMAAERRSP